MRLEKLNVCQPLRVFCLCSTVFLFGGCPQMPDFPSPPPPIGAYRVFYGDLHNHTNLSDGSGTPAEAYRYARHDAGLDFFSLSDHCYYLSYDKWNQIKAAADGSNEDSTFVALWGFEWTDYTIVTATGTIYTEGHVGVIATGDYCTTNDTAADTFTELCAWLSTRDGIAFFNHPNPAISTEFNRFSDPPLDKFVGMELWSGSGAFDWYYYNDGMFPDDNNKGIFDETLFRGWKIGAAGGGDNHSADWGTRSDRRLAVLAHHLTREDILDALWARRFYSTLDRNIALSFTVDNNEMGSTVSGCSHTLKVSANDGDNERFIEVMLFNMRHDTVNTWLTDTSQIEISYDVNSVADDYFYVKIRQLDGDEAISSPVWISCDTTED